MEDQQVLNRIKELTAHEEKLWGKTDISEEEVQKLHEMKLELDQCWDLLRQRRALRDAGEILTRQRQGILAQLKITNNNLLKRTSFHQFKLVEGCPVYKQKPTKWEKTKASML